MIALGTSFACWLVGAALAFFLRRRRIGATLGVAGALAGGVTGSLAAVRALLGGATVMWTAPWDVPAGALAIRLDPLAGFFLLPIAIVGALASVYGVAYLARLDGRHSLGASLGAYNLLLASMALVVTANNLVLFLVAWELMTLSSWALVVTDHEHADVRAAGRLYLIAGHVATAALLLFAVLLATDRGTFAIDALSGSSLRTALFLLALVGFGTKAGIVPLHVWLPDAHPAAPSHVSALMSAVMITMGFYGFARFLPLLGPPALWWAYLLMALGAAGAAGGVLFAIAQEDVKRALAYSTIENAGIATFGMGLGLVATTLGQPLLAALAWTAVLLHLWNHALAKALVFLGFGAVAQGAHSRRLDALGGMLARWPTVGATLVVGAAAIASLPGLNVFASEWLLLRGLVLGLVSLKGIALVAMLIGLFALALTGGVAIVCFTRLVGIGLLGAARTSSAASAVEPGWGMRAPMLALGAGCLAIAALPASVVGALAPAVLSVAPGVDMVGARDAAQPLAVLLPLLAVLGGVGLLLRAVLGRGGRLRPSTTWACGYPDMRASMQYTATSFSEPLTRIAEPLLHMNAPGEPTEVWPAGRIAWTALAPDRVLVGLYEPAFGVLGRAGERIRRLSPPRIEESLLFIVLTVLVMVGLLFL